LIWHLRFFAHNIGFFFLAKEFGGSLHPFAPRLLLGWINERLPEDLVELYAIQ
jgi:hypothetical protein